MDMEVSERGRRPVGLRVWGRTTLHNRVLPKLSQDESSRDASAILEPLAEIGRIKPHRPGAILFKQSL